MFTLSSDKDQRKKIRFRVHFGSVQMNLKGSFTRNNKNNGETLNFLHSK